jgi:hypothetical protein
MPPRRVFHHTERDSTQRPSNFLISTNLHTSQRTKVQAKKNADGVPRVCAEVMLNIVCLNKCVPIHLLLSSNLL